MRAAYPTSHYVGGAEFDYSASTEVDDVALAAAGDTAAFERLYRAHVEKVHGLARWLLGGDDVEDSVQDVFIRVWQKLSQGA